MDNGLLCNSGKAGPGLCLSSSIEGGTCKNRGDNKACRFSFLPELLLAAQNAEDPGERSKNEVGVVPRLLLLLLLDCNLQLGDMGVVLSWEGRGVEGADRLGKLPLIPDPILLIARDKR